MQAQYYENFQFWGEKKKKSGPWIKEEISREIRNYFELNENKNKIYQNVWDAAKACRIKLSEKKKGFKSII